MHPGLMWNFPVATRLDFAKVFVHISQVHRLDLDRFIYYNEAGRFSVAWQTQKGNFCVIFFVSSRCIQKPICPTYQPILIYPYPSNINLHATNLLDETLHFASEVNFFTLDSHFITTFSGDWDCPKFELREKFSIRNGRVGRLERRPTLQRFEATW